MPLPIHFLLFLVGWVSRQQQDVIEYLKAENRALVEQLKGRRFRFTDAQRRRLARRAKALGRRQLREISPLSPRIPCSAGTGSSSLNGGVRDAVRVDLGSPVRFNN
jgi:hypothetical protein